VSSTDYSRFSLWPLLLLTRKRIVFYALVGRLFRSTERVSFNHSCFYNVGFWLFRFVWCFVMVYCVWNVMAYAQKSDFVFRRNGRVHLNRRGRQFSRLLAGELCTSACRVCTAYASLCSAVVWRLMVTHSIILFPPNFSSRTSPCAITFQLDSTASSACPLRNLMYFRSFDSRVKFEICRVMCVLWKYEPIHEVFETRAFPEGYSCCP
jgi:hypothetical protein